MYRLISLAVVLCVASTVHAQLPIQPQTPAPSYSVAKTARDGDLFISYTMKIDHIETRERIEEKDGKKVAVKYKVRVPVLYRKHHKRKLANLVITNAQGKELTEKEVLTLLKNPTIVLVSSDGKKVDPYYLKIVKPDTLVIIDKTPN